MKRHFDRQRSWVMIICVAMAAMIFIFTSKPEAASQDDLEKRVRQLEVKMESQNVDIKNLEALVTEFADELALLNVKVDKLAKSKKNIDQDALSQLEHLIIEFADELALLNVKVAKLEKSLKKQ